MHIANPTQKNSSHFNFHHHAKLKFHCVVKKNDHKLKFKKKNFIFNSKEGL